MSSAQPLNPDADAADEARVRSAAAPPDGDEVAVRAAIAELMESDRESLQARVLDGLPEAVISIDAGGIITGAWGACEAIFGVHADDVLGTDAYARVHPDDIAYAAGALAEAITRTGEHIPINLRVRTDDGRWVLSEAAAGRHVEPELLLISLRPLAYRGHMDERRADLQRRCLHIASAVAAAHGDQLEAAIVAAVASINEFFQSAAAKFCAPGPKCAHVGASVAWPDRTDLPAGTYREHGRHGEHTVFEVHVPAGGDARWWLGWSAADPGTAGWDGAHVDDLQLAGAVIASAWARLELEADLVRRSRQDPLTGLANRVELERSLQRVLDDSSATVLFCDLDGYKLVNDRFGHRIGDRVLAAVAGRLNGALRTGDMLARVGGDEFVAVCRELAPHDLPAIVSRLEQALAAPIRVESTEVIVGVSVGAATGGRGVDAAVLIGEADAAMYAAKSTRKSPT